MNIAILSLSENGKDLAENLKSILIKDSTIIKVDTFYKNVKDTIENIFDYNSDFIHFSYKYTQKYDAIIGIMATGILIRSVAPFLESKSKDPAIIGIDENANFVISLVSGHLGRSNELTEKIANLLDSQAVITTATDINNKLGIDILANELYLDILDIQKILNFNKAILKNEIITLITTEHDSLYLNKFLKDYSVNMNLKIDERINKGIIATFDDEKLTLIPKKLIIGIGCKKGKSKDEILNAINSALKTFNFDINRVDYLATAEIKENEAGILELSKELNVPLKIASMEHLKNFECEICSKSEFVKSKFGIDGVCEQSALIVGGKDSELIYKKTAFNGVTIAMVISI